MGKESPFSTPRPKMPSASEMLENAKAVNEARIRNMQALHEAYKLNQNFVDSTQATLEAAERKATEEAKTDRTLEAMYYRRGAARQAGNKLGMRTRLIEEGYNTVRDTVLYKIIYEAYYLDDPVKESLMESVEDIIDQTLSMIQENCTSSMVPTSKHSKFLVNVEEAVKDITNKASDRLVKHAMESAFDDPEFELSEEECDELDEKLTDLGKDEIVDLVKSKIASVVQDERERGMERSEMFNELDKLGENPDSEDTETSDGEVEPTTGEEGTEESTLSGDGIGIMEGIVPRKNADGSVEMVPYSYSFESAIKSVPESVHFTTGETRILNILMECDTYDVTEDPSCDEFKSYVSGICKSIVGQINNGNYRDVCGLIDAYTTRLGSVSGENISGDTKEYINAMTSLIYGEIPPDEIIINRLGRTFGSPDAQITQPIDIGAFDWTNLLVNIKTNLANVKEWCYQKIMFEQVETLKPTDPVKESVASDPFTQLQYNVMSQRLNRSIGNTLFESIMLRNLTECETEAATLEATGNLEPDTVENSAMVQTLLEYTVFETLNTLGLYDFRASDLNKCKQIYMDNISESKSMFHREDNKGNLENKRKKRRLTKHIIKPYNSKEALKK